MQQTNMSTSNVQYQNTTKTKKAAENTTDSIQQVLNNRALDTKRRRFPGI